MTEAISEIEENFRQRAQKRQWVSLIAATYLRLGFPALLSLTILYKNDLGDAFWPVIITTSLVQILSVLVRVFTGKSETALTQADDEDHSSTGGKNRSGASVSYYDFAPDRLFQRYLQGDEDAGRKALEAVRREVESDLHEARL